ncbi:MAG: hypothetical protein COB37_06555 [Kordiimonadales bacterium]|nr:MAG: hypothetical protein COB37_06555 [Kordiimonadales bacterium]
MRQLDLLLNTVKIFWYGIYFWRKPPAERKDTQYFSYHLTSQDAAGLKFLIVYFFLELAGAHLLLATFKPELLWPVFWLGVVSLLLPLGTLVAWRVNPVRVTEKSLHLFRGLKHNHVLSFRDIVAVKLGYSAPEADSLAHVWKPMSMTDPNITVVLEPGSLLRRHWFRKSKPTHIALFLDEPGPLKRCLMKNCKAGQKWSN